MIWRVFISIVLVLLAGCSTIKKTLPPELEVAQQLAQTKTFSELSGLPAPAGSIPVSVYSFRDQTGQYKPQTNVSSFSTAVTQGANSILVQALHESDWFIPVEREGLQNILTERKIVRAALSNKEDEAAQLPPLTTAKIILEGGVISYDSNVKTGGLGAEYFGIGASELYREDIISIYLRAVDVRTGQVLLSVATTKKVLSIEMRAGFFRYVSYKRLAEAEAGFSENEPMHICVKQAIEKALSELVHKGIDKGVWTTKQQSIALAKTRQQKQLQLAALKAKQQKAQSVKRNVAPSISFMVQFRTATAEIEPLYNTQLEQVLALLSQQKSAHVELFGYADKRGDDQSNHALSLARSNAIANYLITNGIAKERVSIMARGDDDAHYDTADNEGLFFDRRVIINLKSS